MKGIFEFEVSGQTRGFKFGTYGISVACEKEGCSVDTLYRRCGIPYKDSEGAVKNDKPSLKALLHLFYGVAVHYADYKRSVVDFSVSDVSDWIDEIGLDRLHEMIVEGLNQYLPKNSKSPKEMGEAVIQ